MRSLLAITVSALALAGCVTENSYNGSNKPVVENKINNTGAARTRIALAVEYLSTGKVCVSHYIDQYKNTTLVEMVTNNVDLPRKFSEVIQALPTYNSTTKMEERKAFAHKNTYRNQLINIEEKLTKIA